MSQVALIIRHRTQPGKRDQVRAVWERHVRPAITANPDHLAYFYCFDDHDPDSIIAFQVYTDTEAANAFLATDRYGAYQQAVEPLLQGPPDVVGMTPVWSKVG